MTPASRSRRSGCSRERRVHAGRDVGHGRDLERDAGRRELLDEARILDRAHAVTDPVGRVLRERLPDVLRSGPFPGVGDAPQPGVLRSSEHRRERGHRRPLAAGGVQRDDAAPRELQRDLERALGVLRSVVAHDVRADEDPDAVVAPARLQSVEHRLDRAVPVVEPGRVVARTEHRLRVADAVRGEVRAELLRDPSEVLRGRQERAGLDVVVDEVEEAVEAPPAIRTEPVRERGAAAFGQFTEGRDPHRSLQVDVELHLGEGAQVSHGPMVASAA